MIIISRKFEKLNFIKKLLKLKSFKVDNHSINSRNYATAYHQTLDEVPSTLEPENDEKFKKDSKKL